jgi:NADH:ubiquinone oxidoreductase subunit 2 (subunit N)
MNKKLTLSLPSLVSLHSFSVFPEYFLSISIIYVLIVVTLITYNIFNLMLQKALSESMTLILLMTSYLIFNDDLLTLNFSNFNNSIINDYFAFFTKIIICLFSAFYFFIAGNFLKEQKLTSFEYLLIILFAILGLMLMCSSNDLLTAYLAIELSSLAFYVLASFRKTSSYSVESGIKYFVTGAISSAFFLLGSSFIYGLTGSINFTDFHDLFECSSICSHPYYIFSNSSICSHPYYIFSNSCDLGADEIKKLIYIVMLMDPDSIVPYIAELFFTEESFNSSICSHPYYIFSNSCDLGADEIKKLIYIVMLMDPDSIVPYIAELFFTEESFNSSFVEFGLTLVLFSLFIKLSLAPFHLWSLDVYEGSPTSSTFFFAVITKLSIFVLLIRLCYQSFFSLKSCWQFYSLWIGIFSIFIGSFGGLKQRRLKTLLAYSSTSHMGYALIAFSTSTFIGIQMFLFYILIYMVSGLCVWYIILLLRVKKNFSEKKYSKELSDLTLLRKSNTALAFFLSLTMFSIAGIPPLVGFLAKMSIFLSVVGISFYFIAIASIICSVVSTFYYIRIIKVLYFENLLVGKLYYPIKTTKTIILSVLIFSLFFFFCNPTILYLVTYKAIMCLFFKNEIVQLVRTLES